MKKYISEIKIESSNHLPYTLNPIRYTLSVNEGISLIMSILILSLVLSTAIAVSAIFTGEIKSSRIFYNSTLAYYAADSGAEAALYLIRKGSLPDGVYTCKPGDDTLTLGTVNQGFADANITCEVEVTGSAVNVKSTGLFKNGEAKRKIQIRL